MKNFRSILLIPFIIVLVSKSHLYSQETNHISFNEFQSIIDGEKDTIAIVFVVQAWAIGTVQNFISMYKRNSNKVQASKAKMYFLIIPFNKNGEADLERTYQKVGELNKKYFGDIFTNHSFGILYSQDMFIANKNGVNYFDFGDKSFIGPSFKQGVSPVVIMNKSKSKYIFQALGDALPPEKVFDYLE